MTKSQFDFEETSDRFNLRDLKDNSIIPALLPLKAIERLDFFRSRGFLPSSSQVIVNVHQELAIDLPGLTEKANILLNSLLTSIYFSQNKTLILEPNLETLDLYSVNKKENFTKRLRFYYQNNQIHSVRTIIADTSPRNPLYWEYESTRIPIRPEFIFVVRNDAKEQVASAKNSFFETHSTIQAVVYKQVMRGNFGHSTMWDHRGAVYQDSYGEMVNATEKHSAIGMSSYISFSKQKIMKTEFSRSLSTEGVSTLIEYMLNGKFSPRETYSQLIAHEKNKSITPHFRIEIETNNYLKEASSIAHQLIGTKGIFNQANIDFAISSSRKIST